MNITVLQFSPSSVLMKNEGKSFFQFLNLPSGGEDAAETG